MKNLQHGITVFILTLNTIHFTDAVSFDVTLTNSTGEFQSPRYPNNYLAQDTSTYNIITQPGTFIRLRWKLFEVWDQAPDCNNVYVRIWIGCPGSLKMLTRFCTANDSNIIPPDLYSNDHCMKIEFNTLSTMTKWNRGRFVAEYKQLLFNQSLETTKCEDMDISRRSIHSTNYPLPYYGQGNCKFTLYFGNKNIAGVKVLFTKIDTSTPYSGAKLCMAEQNDYIRMKNVKKTGQIQYYRFCSTQKWPFTRIYWKTKRLEITMNTPVKWNNRNKGYMISYFPIWNSAAAADADKNEESGGLATGWIVFLVILGVVTLFIIYIKRRLFKWKCKKARWNCLNCCYGVKDNMIKQDEPETVSPAFNPPGIVVASYTAPQNENPSPYQPPTYKNYSSFEQSPPPMGATPPTQHSASAPYQSPSAPPQSPTAPGDGPPPFPPSYNDSIGGVDTERKVGFM
ncbi:uncharacterized protein [Clytia hemisphaerica]